MSPQLKADSRIAIIGGGIGGLTLANALQRKGWSHIKVLEQWREVKTRGGAISIMPAQMGGCQGVLEALGLQDAVAAVGQPTKNIESYFNGGLVWKLQLRFGTRVMREALQHILLESLAPDTVRLATSICGVREVDDEVELELDNGTVEKFDFVVAADGINSVVAKSLFPDTEKQFAGTVVYQCLAQGEFLPSDFYEHHVDCGDYGFTIRAFSGSGFDGRWDSVAFTVRSDTPVSSSWDGEGTTAQIQPLLDALRRHGGGCPEWLLALVEKSERVMRWGIYETGFKPSWVSPAGRLVLLGDAAHAMAPFLGMGAQSAMLDAHALASELTQRDFLADALHAYQAQRKAPVEDIMRGAKFEGMCMTSFGASATYRSKTRPLVHFIHRCFLQSSWRQLRGLGAVLIRVQALGQSFCEFVSSLNFFRILPKDAKLE